MKRSPKPNKQEEPPNVEDGLLQLALMHVDTLLERIRSHKLKAFDASLLTQLHKLSTKEIKRLNHQYARTYEDMKAAIGGDKIFLEGYSNYDVVQMKIALAMFKGIRALKHDDNIATGRFSINTRKCKQKPPDQIVKKVLFLEKDTETGVSSLNPVELVGAAMLWVYNVKTRKLGAYIAKTEAGLFAKGTTVLNFDETLSTTKTLRKPKKQLNEFVSKSPSEQKRFWNAIRAIPQNIGPRLSRESLILRVIRA